MTNPGAKSDDLHVLILPHQDLAARCSAPGCEERVIVLWPHLKVQLCPEHAEKVKGDLIEATSAFHRRGAGK